MKKKSGAIIVPVTISASAVIAALSVGYMLYPEKYAFLWAKAGTESTTPGMAKVYSEAAQRMEHAVFDKFRGLTVNTTDATFSGVQTHYRYYAGNDPRLDLTYPQGGTVSFTETHGKLQITGTDDVPAAADAAKDAVMLLNAESFVDQYLVIHKGTDYAKDFAQAKEQMNAFANKIERQQSSVDQEQFVGVPYIFKNGIKILVAADGLEDDCPTKIEIVYANGSRFSVVDFLDVDGDPDHAKQHNDKLNITAIGNFPPTAESRKDAYEVLTDTPFVENGLLVDYESALNARAFGIRIKYGQICPRSLSDGPQ